MTYQSLIEKIRQAIETGFLPDGDGVPVSVNLWLEDLIRQHEADSIKPTLDKSDSVKQDAGDLLQRGEICDVKELQTEIYGSMPSGMLPSEADETAIAIMDIIRPYLATREPVSVSLEKCAMAALDCAISMCPDDMPELMPEKLCSFDREVTKAVLDAAGVKYV